MEVVIMVAQLLVSLSILVILHECGHFFPARWFNTRVEKFYLFFYAGFSLLKFKKGDTEYGIGWLPLGGYVKISGMIDESFDTEQMAGPVQPWEFRAKPAWQRLIIMLGGVTVNFVLAIIVFAGIALYWGEKYFANEDIIHGIAAERFGEQIGLQDGDHILRVGTYSFEEFDIGEVARLVGLEEANNITVLREGKELTLPIEQELVLEMNRYENREELLFNMRIPLTVGAVTQGMEASRIGLQEGDEIVEVGSRQIQFFDEFTEIARTLPNKESVVKVIRGTDTVAMNATFDSIGRLGFLPYGPSKFYELRDREFSLGGAIIYGFGKTVGFIGDQMTAFGQMAGGGRKASESVGSFISIGKMFEGNWDWHRFWWMTASLSALLGFINLLPIPALDGGHVMFLLWEVITGRKPSEKFLEYSTFFGFIIIICLMIFAVSIDIMRHI